MIIFPEMIGSVVGIYNGKVFNQVEIKVGYAGFLLDRLLRRHISFLNWWNYLCYSSTHLLGELLLLCTVTACHKGRQQ